MNRKAYTVKRENLAHYKFYRHWCNCLSAKINSAPMIFHICIEFCHVSKRFLLSLFKYRYVHFRNVYAVLQLKLSYKVVIKWTTVGYKFFFKCATNFRRIWNIQVILQFLSESYYLFYFNENASNINVSWFIRSLKLIYSAWLKPKLNIIPPFASSFKPFVNWYSP